MVFNKNLASRYDLYYQKCLSIILSLETWSRLDVFSRSWVFGLVFLAWLILEGAKTSNKYDGRKERVWLRYPIWWCQFNVTFPCLHGSDGVFYNTSSTYPYPTDPHAAFRAFFYLHHTVAIISYPYPTYGDICFSRILSTCYVPYPTASISQAWRKAWWSQWRININGANSSCIP